MIRNFLSILKMRNIIKIYDLVYHDEYALSFKSLNTLDFISRRGSRKTTKFIITSLM